MLGNRALGKGTTNLSNTPGYRLQVDPNPSNLGNPNLDRQFIKSSIKIRNCCKVVGVKPLHTQKVMKSFYDSDKDKDEKRIIDVRSK